ncbi:MAG: hypothetical protein R3D68_00225 [Hyphomicrobiaceae bacterium]
MIEAAGEGRDTIYTEVSYTLAPGSSVEMLCTWGSATTYAVDLTGNDLANTIVGNSANNKIDGGAGADLMWGYGGDDTYYVDNAGDRVVELQGQGYDTIISNVSYVLAAGSEIELLRTWGTASTAAIDFTGNALANTIVGNAADNRLDGGGGNDLLWSAAGNDRLIGGAGNDTLNGGLGADTFVFDTALDTATNVDTIQDFMVGMDLIELDGAVFTTLAAGSLQASAFIAASSAQTADQRIVYDAATGALSYDADGSGAGTAVQFAILSQGLMLTHTDFFVS